MFNWIKKVFKKNYEPRVLDLAVIFEYDGELPRKPHWEKQPRDEKGKWTKGKKDER